ncbi:hypothetical protein Bhyg_08635 [Pseudolycoriella hygida]|uniref:Uncharacterized protein n=1 Tax=Pseudolycoriella hygida TaxID=35572 RepID=A0A9Q0N6A3_9DIPT|nr:hypothetical protein Bhyg_08635 [Pseudolycoriella hygida]
MMKVKVVSSSNNVSTDNTIKDRFPSKRLSVNDSLCRMSKVINHLIPKSQHFADDVKLLEYTIEYLKQTAEYQRGIGFCAEETKTFLEQSVFDRRKLGALIRLIEQRINYIAREEHIEVNNNGETDGRVFNSIDVNHIKDSANNNGVLLDLSLKRNRLAGECDYNSNANPSHSLNNKLKKREILDKIRKKILDKRRVSCTTQKVEIVQNEIMWRPWRY